MPSTAALPAASPRQRLHPHQTRALSALQARFVVQTPASGLLVMPTGSGKTIVGTTFALEAAVAEGRQVLWLTHRTALVRQTAQVLDEACQGLDITVRLIGGQFEAADTLSAPGGEVVVAMIPSLQSERALQALAKWVRRAPTLVILDEAHHAPATTWTRVIECVKAAGASVLGLTATPVRSAATESKQLFRIFGGDGDDPGTAIVHEERMADLVAAGVLSRLTVHAIATNVEVVHEPSPDDMRRLQQGNLPPKVEAQLAQHAWRNGLIVEKFLEGPDGSGTYGPTIAFAINIVHADLLVDRFAQAGVSAAAVHHAQGDERNREVLEDFRAGEIQVVVSVDMLTEGVDVPSTTTVIMARPTMSVTVFSQMVGRALRGPAVGGTEIAHLIDVQDVWSGFPGWRTASWQDLVNEQAAATRNVHRQPRDEHAGAPSRQFDAGSVWEKILEGAIESERVDAPVGFLLLDHGDTHTVVLVYQSEEQAWDRVRSRVGEAVGVIDVLALIRDEAALQVAPSLADQVADHVQRFGEVPALVAFEQHDQLQPLHVARRAVTENVPPQSFAAWMSGIADGHDRAISRWWGGRATWARRVSEAFAQALIGN